MNVVERPSDEHFHRSTWVNVVVSILRAILYTLRMVIFAPLAVFEPIIGTVLAGTCFVGLSACVFYKIADSTGVHHHHIPYGLLIGVSLSAGVLLVLYYKLMRWLAP